MFCVQRNKIVMIVKSTKSERTHFSLLVLKKKTKRVVQIYFHKMDSDRNVENKITPLYVLLPLYTELKQDIFLEILKKVVSRTRFGEDFIECAFTSGMTEKTLFIESKDLSMDCNGETSMSELVSLIGFWAVNNFPSLGRKLLGQSWQPSKERIVNIGNQDILDDKLIDATVFKKLKLRVIELSVSESTWTKVKHFVAVPAGVCDDNPERISKKMKMFSIKDAYIDDCWKALKLGKFITNDDLEVSFFKQNYAVYRLKYKL